MTLKQTRKWIRLQKGDRSWRAFAEDLSKPGKRIHYSSLHLAAMSQKLPSSGVLEALGLKQVNTPTFTFDKEEA